MEEGEIWGEADITYPGWKGTAQLDPAMTKPSIAELVGLEDGWTVIGIDIGGGEYGHGMHVVAVPTDIFPEGGGGFAAVAEAHDGAIPATDFKIHDVDPYDLLQKVTHMFELRLRPAALADGKIPVLIVERDDLPPQDDD